VLVHQLGIPIPAFPVLICAAARASAAPRNVVPAATAGAGVNAEW